jgi:hypothetical protein
MRQTFIEKGFAFYSLLLQTNGIHFRDDSFAVQLGLDLRKPCHGNSFQDNSKYLSGVSRKSMFTA